MKKEILFLGMVLMSQIVMAHADHAPKVAACAAKTCTKAEIVSAVPMVIQTVSKEPNIGPSWNTAKIEKVEQKEFKKGKEWVATIFDEKQADVKKQRLFIFITNSGYLSGVNFTGE